jgi:Mg2+ and Co2+ transporter CorA
MNFPNMPAWRWTWRYPLAIALMIGLFLASLFHVKEKKWL